MTITTSLSFHSWSICLNMSRLVKLLFSGFSPSIFIYWKYVDFWHYVHMKCLRDVISRNPEAQAQSRWRLPQGFTQLCVGTKDIPLSYIMVCLYLWIHPSISQRDREVLNSSMSCCWVTTWSWVFSLLTSHMTSHTTIVNPWTSSSTMQSALKTITINVYGEYMCMLSCCRSRTSWRLQKRFRAFLIVVFLQLWSVNLPQVRLQHRAHSRLSVWDESTWSPLLCWLHSALP